MNRETILVLLMVLFLLLLFLASTASDAVPAAVLPVMTRKEVIQS